MIITGLGIGLAMGLNIAEVNVLNLQSYSKPPVALRRYLEMEPMVNFNSLFGFEANNNSAFVSYNRASSYINSEEGDIMLSNARHIKTAHAKVISSRRADSEIRDLGYFEFTDNIELNTPARKTIKAKAKVVSSRRADHSLV
jgi:predicted lactoylglutathione lyase